MKNIYITKTLNIMLFLLFISFLIFGFYVRNTPPININEVCDATPSNEKSLHVKCVAAIGMLLGIKTFLPYTNVLASK
jgi:hypothetical protein